MKGLQRSLGLLLLLLTFSTHALYAQKVTVTGVVRDADGEIPGVNVLVKGTTQGTITDVMGNYQISVDNPGEAVLVFRFIGYQPQEIKVGNRTKIDVTLKTDSELIDDVVVVGYGEQKKKSVVGAITQAKGEELLQAGSVTTVSEALTGLLPGVSTMQASGQPGSTAASILIRGVGSWEGSSPLYLVDGVERDFNSLDPNEIESISVLKDASATAVYGVKGANGVILVTTKNGKKGKAKINFSANVGWKVPTIETDYAADFATSMEYYNQASLNEGLYDNLVPQFYIDRFRDPAYADNPFYQYHSFINEMFKTGQTQQYNLNVSGGNDFVTYFTSFGYNYDGDIFDLEKQEDYDPRTYQRRFNWRTNLDFNLTKSTKFHVKLSGDMTNWNGNYATKNASGGVAGNGGSIMQRIFATALVNVPAEFEDGRLGWDRKSSSVNLNYLGQMEQEGQYYKRSSRLYSDFILEQQIAKGLKASAKFSYNQNQSYLGDIDQRWNNKPVYFTIPSADGYNPDLDENGNIIIQPNSAQLDDWENPASLKAEKVSAFSKDIYYEFRLNYDKSFGNHNIGLLGLFQRREAQNGSKFPKYSEDWVGRFTYNYKEKYLLEISGSYNGNENFSPEKRFGFFPSIAPGWVISEENFIKENAPWIDFLKVRYSYGEVGAHGALNSWDDDKRFRFLSYYSSNGMPFEYGYLPNITGGNTNGLTMYTEGAPATPWVTWETSIKQNLGFEFNTFDNQLKAVVDLFDERREGILMQRRTIPNWYGNVFPYDNMGETKNHGFDLELTWNDQLGADASYWLKGNISVSENRIVERDDPAPTPEYMKDAGKAIGWNKGYQAIEQHQGWDDVYTYSPTALLTSYMPGDLVYNDYNADGVIDSNDIVAIGSPNYATKSYAFSFGFNYKNLTLTMMFNGMWDLSKQISNNYLYAYDTMTTTNFMLKNNEQKDAWMPHNTDTNTPSLRSIETDYYKATSTYSLRDASFLRLRNVELKYKVPKHILDRTNFFDNIEFYVNGNNLHTWQTLPSAFDPEAKKLEVYPITKRYNFGLRLNL